MLNYKKVRGFLMLNYKKVRDFCLIREKVVTLAVAVPQSGHEKARKKRVHHELMAHPSKTINNFTKLITYQSSSFCLPASLLHSM